MNGKAGGAFVTYSNSTELYSKSFRLSDNATVYSAELSAIKLAINEPEIMDIKHLLANHEGAIRLFWIKAAGMLVFSGNERADEYAKQATTKDTIDIEVDLSKSAKKRTK
ncbi:hypothetical protein CEXT_526971 [Caerostris extrusa]|uniref:RNase H type-1 domain-containing protein n=1 Tax=Caerostris extrusa TaxID=172846 RepID=A0AAV4VB06_CAEEX|nr:hypothetical protein CEXT_526971 [Caerostris extrusa]